MPKRDASPESAYDSADEIDNNLTTSVKSSSKSSKSKTYTSASKTKARERVEPESESDEEATEKPQSHSEEGSGSGDEDEEEFEIESIEDAKIGAIDEHPDEVCFYVKWKGYSEDENSWTTEENATGAAELIRKFWRARARANKPSRDDLLAAHQKKKDRQAKAKSRTSKGGRKSSASSTPIPRKSSPTPSSDDLGDKNSKKRPSTSNKKSAPTTASKRPRVSSHPDDEMDVDETTADNGRMESETPPPPTKKRKSDFATALNGRNASKTGKVAKERTPMVQEEDIVLGTDNTQQADRTWERFGKLKSWDNIIQKVVTVEGDQADLGNKTGRGYWVMFKDFDDNIHVTRSTIMHTKAPAKLCLFYESNLKFRPDSSHPDNQ